MGMKMEQDKLEQDKMEQNRLNSQKMLMDKKCKKLVIDDKITENENKQEIIKKPKIVEKFVKNETISHLGNGDYTIKQESVKIRENDVKSPKIDEIDSE